jgi:hypothetical protein
VRAPHRFCVTAKRELQPIRCNYLDRYILNHFLQQIEAAILPTAIKYAPEGSEPKAIVHQWIHAIASGNKPFAAQRGATSKKLINILKMESLYEDAESFKKNCRKRRSNRPKKAHSLLLIYSPVSAV